MFDFSQETDFTNDSFDFVEPSPDIGTGFAVSGEQDTGNEEREQNRRVEIILSPAKNIEAGDDGSFQPADNDSGDLF